MGQPRVAVKVGKERVKGIHQQQQASFGIESHGMSEAILTFNECMKTFKMIM